MRKRLNLWALLLVLLFTTKTFAVISTSAVWEVRSTATTGNVNGGFFKTGATGTDFSQQNAAQFNLTSAACAGAGNVVTHASAAASMVGNGAYVVSGTNMTSGATAGRFEVTAVSAGVSITFSTNLAGTAICTGVSADGVINIGGALSLGTTDDLVFEVLEDGMKMWIKDGDYTVGGTVAMSNNGGTQAPIEIEGYSSTRGDRPAGDTRPNLDAGTAVFTVGTNVDFRNVIFTGSATSVLTSGTNGKVMQSKITNTSTTTNRTALTLGTDGLADRVEAISYRGPAIASALACMITGSYMHDSAVGYRNSGTSSEKAFIANIVANNYTAALQFTAGNIDMAMFYGNTLYGFSTPTGIGVDLATGTTDTRLINNIIYGFVTGVNHADVQTVGFDSYNDYFNNTTNATNWTLGTSSITTNPVFAGVGQIAGTTATTGASGVLTDSAASFTTVTDNVDFIYVVSGTGVTAGQYLITAHTATTVTTSPNISSNATADKVYRISTGDNYRPATAVKGLGYPGLLPGGLSTSYSDMGAIQRQEDYATAANTKTGVSASGGDITGTYTGSDRWSDPGVTNVRRGTVYKADSTSNNRTGTMNAGGLTTFGNPGF